MLLFRQLNQMLSIAVEFSLLFCGNARINFQCYCGMSRDVGMSGLRMSCGPAAFQLFTCFRALCFRWYIDADIVQSSIRMNAARHKREG